MGSCGKLAIVLIVCGILVICVIAIVLGLYFGLRDDDDDDDSGTGGGSSDRVVSTSGQYQRAAVASDSALCSEAGAQILADGGSAVDGTIATILCLGVVNCHSTGISGGGFMVVHQNDDPGNPVVIDFREVAPSNATKDMYQADADLSVTGKPSYIYIYIYMYVCMCGFVDGNVHVCICI